MLRPVYKVKNVKTLNTTYHNSFNKMKELPDDYLKNIRFAVCGLGDSAYDIFNGFGKDIEIEMNRLGGELITERVDCDIDFEELSDPWIEKIFNHEKGMREPI